MKLRFHFLFATAFALLSMGSLGCNEFSQVNVDFSGTHVSFSESSPQAVLIGNTLSISVTPDEGYALTSAVQGTCPAGSWSGNVYTTGVILADCSLLFSASSNPQTVTPSGENVSIDPSDSQIVDYNATASFTVTADEGYVLSDLVGGNCPAGVWEGAIYTTGAITEDCTVVFSASADAETFIITASAVANGSISPDTPQEVSAGDSLVFTATPDLGYDVDSWYVDNILTQTGGASFMLVNITADHAVRVTFSQNVFTVGGTVSGLSGTVVLQNNGGDNLSLSSDGSFTFSTPVAEGASYNVTVLTQPAGQTCSVTNGSGTMGGSNVTNVGVSCATDSTTLSVSLSELALSVTGYTEFGVSGTPSSGLARTITISNTGSVDAANLSISYPTWPSGTTANSNCGGSLASGASCSITVTPGITASSDGTNPCTGGTAPIASSIFISADNAGAVSTDVLLLGYGCIYQGGYVYAFDDTTASTASVGGKVATFFNQSGSMIWSSNSSGTFDGGVAIYGISETSTTASPNPSSGQVAGQAACNGAVDGSCNTNNIYVYYENSATGAPINPSFYAAGLCKSTISGFSDWYLPSICELGYDTASAGSGCGSSGAPALQNMQSNLVDFNALALLNGAYWSSTELSTGAQGTSWRQNFNASGSSGQFVNSKAFSLSVRCSRGF